MRSILRHASNRIRFSYLVIPELENQPQLIIYAVDVSFLLWIQRTAMNALKWKTHLKDVWLGTLETQKQGI